MKSVVHSWQRVAVAVFAVGMLGGLFATSPASATEAPDQASGGIEVCDGESLDLTHPSGRLLTESEIALASEQIRGICASKNARGTLSPLSGAGQYVVNNTKASLVSCSCGSYKKWSIKVTVTGMPLSGEKYVSILYRFNPGSTKWTFGPVQYAAATDPGINVPVVTGTMASNQLIQSSASYYRNGKLVEQILAGS